MKKIVFLAIAAFLLLSGCGVIKENAATGASVAVSELNMSDNQYPGRVDTTAVYFLNEASGTLTAELRMLVIDQDANPAEVAVQALLGGPSSNEELTGVAPGGMTLDYIEFSRDLANVYLEYDGETMLPEDRYILEAALANTITDLLGATYICVFYNGAAAGYFGVPTSPMQKQTGRIEDAWRHAEAAYKSGVPVIEEVSLPDEQVPGEADIEPQPDTTEPIETAPSEPVQSTIATVLYFVSSDGKYILPEVRNVTYINGDYFDTLIEELQIGPQNASIMTGPIADDVILEDAQLTQTEDGRYIASLQFSELPTQYDDSDTNNALRSYAAVMYTITGLIPDIDSVQMYVNDTLVTPSGDEAHGSMQRDDFLGYIGSSVPIYFADENSDLLLEVPRSMEQSKTWSAKERVLQIFAAPQMTDEENAETVIQTGMSATDVLSVDVYGDTAYANFSSNFKEVCAGWSSRNEMRLVFSIVNTITAIDGINKVQFLIEGEQTARLSGTLCLSDPFLRNYGIIKQSG